MGECITLPSLDAVDESLDQPNLRKRLDVIPKRLLESGYGGSVEFDKDTKRWRRRIRHYVEVRVHDIDFSVHEGEAPQIGAVLGEDNFWH